MKNESFMDILLQFYRITNKINSIRNKEISFNGIEPMNTPTIHFIDAVGKNPDANISEIADILGITKGAVSQMSAKLVKKGIVEKYQEEQNAKEIYLSLTNKGWDAYRGHEELHKKLYMRLYEIMGNFSDETVQDIRAILSEIDVCVTEYEHI